MATRIPKSVMVLGRRYRVDLVRLDGYHGNCQTAPAVIEINSDDPATMQRETLLHELLHAILFEAGWEFALEESGLSPEGLVRAIEHGIVRSGLL